MKDKITDSEKEDIKKSIDNLKKAVSERNFGDIEKYQKELEGKWSPIVQKMYQSQSGTTATSNPFNFAGSPFEGFNPTASTGSTANNSSDFEEVK